MNNLKIAILGDGGWGTTLSLLLHNKGYNIVIWSAFNDYAKAMEKSRENIKFLPGIEIPRGIKITSNIDEVAGSGYYIVSIPCKYLKETLRKFKTVIDKPIVSAVKGIENDTLKRPSEIIREILGNLPYSVLSGPTIAYEMVRGVPTTCVIASENRDLALKLQEVFTTEKFRVYTSDDVIGVELGGALKNIIAIAAGISDGMGFGANTKSALLTRGLVEIQRLGVKMGAKADTFFGLTGVGDLATTCMSPHSRNRTFGEMIGKGKNIKEILSKTSMVIEGVNTAKSAYQLAKKVGVEMPITEEIYKVIYEAKDPKQAVKDLMTRTPKSEN